MTDVSYHITVLEEIWSYYLCSSSHKKILVDLVINVLITNIYYYLMQLFKYFDSCISI